MILLYWWRNRQTLPWRGRCNLAGLAVGRRNTQTVAKRVERRQKRGISQPGFLIRDTVHSYSISCHGRLASAHRVDSPISMARVAVRARSRQDGRYGLPALSAELPCGGWPLGVLVELLLPQPGTGETRLLKPALAVYGTWQCEGEVRHLVAQRVVDMSYLLGGLTTISRDIG